MRTIAVADAKTSRQPVLPHLHFTQLFGSTVPGTTTEAARIVFSLVLLRVSHSRAVTTNARTISSGVFAELGVSCRTRKCILPLSSMLAARRLVPPRSKAQTREGTEGNT